MRFTLVLLAALAVQVAAAHLMGAGQIPGPSWWERNLAFVEKEPLPALAEHFGVDGAATLWFAAWTDVTRRLGGRFRLNGPGLASFSGFETAGACRIVYVRAVASGRPARRFAEERP